MLHAVRPPNSGDDWNSFKELVRTANAEEIRDCWELVLESATEFDVGIDRWISSLTELLSENMGNELVRILRKVLNRQSQSLSAYAQELRLPLQNKRYGPISGTARKSQAW
jgi:hypothetical protein